MRGRDRQRHSRRELAWYLAGFALVQAALAVAVDACWPTVRDPDFAEVAERLRDRLAETPDRPLIVILGSSRLQLALRPAQLGLTSANDPLVMNCSVCAAGPMMHQIALRRLLDAGIRPHLVCIEAMPLQFSLRQGVPVEERAPFAYRYSAAEVTRLWPYYAEPHRLAYGWLSARMMPWRHHGSEIRKALGIADPITGHTLFPRDEFGWNNYAGLPNPEITTAWVSHSLEQYGPALAEPDIAPGPAQALRDLLRFCAEERIAAVLVVPAEGSAFRNFAPTAHEAHMAAIRGIARELGVPVVDSSAWVDDAGFWDGHHMWTWGADQYTERFGREVLRPLMRR